MSSILPGAPGVQEADPVSGRDALIRFRARLYGCFDRRADALFELTDAVLTGPDRVWSLVELSQEKAFRRGHGALYDGLGHLHHARYETFEEARADIANYIELFYNQERLHSGLAYQTPHEVHYGFLKPQVAG